MSAGKYAVAVAGVEKERRFSLNFSNILNVLT